MATRDHWRYRVRIYRPGVNEKEDPDASFVRVHGTVDPSVVDRDPPVLGSIIGTEVSKAIRQKLGGQG